MCRSCPVLSGDEQAVTIRQMTAIATNVRFMTAPPRRVHAHMADHVQAECARPFCANPFLPHPVLVGIKMTYPRNDLPMLLGGQIHGDGEDVASYLHFHVLHAHSPVVF